MAGTRLPSFYGPLGSSQQLFHKFRRMYNSHSRRRNFAPQNNGSEFFHSVIFAARLGKVSFTKRLTENKFSQVFLILLVYARIKNP